MNSNVTPIAPNNIFRYNNTVIPAAEKEEPVLWQEIKSTLNSIEDDTDKIEELSRNVLDQWVTIGNDLIELSGPKYVRQKGVQFASVCRDQGVTFLGKALSANQISAAKWWATLSEKNRDKLKEDFPLTCYPARMQDNCREKYPSLAKLVGVSSRAKGTQTNTAKSGGGSSTKGSVKKMEPVAPPTNESTQSGEAAATVTPITASIPEPQVKLTDKQKLEIKREVYRDEARRERAIKLAAKQAAAAKDTRPKLKESPVTMYGVRMWPIEEHERADLGYHDFDQLFFCIYHFLDMIDLMPKTTDYGSQSIRLQHYMKFLEKFVSRRLVGECKGEMDKFVTLFHKLCVLYANNPDGECVKPVDSCIWQSV